MNFKPFHHTFGKYRILKMCHLKTARNNFPLKGFFIHFCMNHFSSEDKKTNFHHIVFTTQKNNNVTTIMNVFMHLVDEYLVSPYEILHIHITF